MSMNDLYDNISVHWPSTKTDYRIKQMFFKNVHIHAL